MLFKRFFLFLALLPILFGGMESFRHLDLYETILNFDQSSGGENYIINISISDMI